MGLPATRSGDRSAAVRSALYASLDRAAWESGSLYAVSVSDATIVGMLYCDLAIRDHYSCRRRCIVRPAPYFRAGTVVFTFGRPCVVLVLLCCRWPALAIFFPPETGPNNNTTQCLSCVPCVVGARTIARVSDSPCLGRGRGCGGTGCHSTAWVAAGFVPLAHLLRAGRWNSHLRARETKCRACRFCSRRATSQGRCKRHWTISHATKSI